MDYRDECGWPTLFETTADAVVIYRDDRVALIDLLGKALADCAMQFPIVQSGEDFEDICPFTFFASLAREMPDSRRTRLVECLCRAFELEGRGLALDAGESLPVRYPGLHTVDDRSLRFFSSDMQRQSRETDALWRLFSCALSYADERTRDAEDSFIAAFNRAVLLRIPGRHLLPTALSWVRPRFFLPSDCVYESASQCDARNRDTVLDGERYVAMIKSVQNRGDGRAAGSAVFDRALISWNNIRAPEAHIDSGKVESAIDFYCANIETVREASRSKWSAVRLFQENWDTDAPDFHDMLARSLEGYDALVPANPTFNPRKDILVFARNEPEATRSAFRTLFSDDAPMIERMVRFEAETALLFERNRGDIISAIPRRSSHGNYFAISAYLFLRFPDETYLFSPRRMKTLDELTMEGGRHRISDPSTVDEYQRLCEEVCASVRGNEKLIEADGAMRNPEDDWEDTCHHILVDDLIVGIYSVSSGCMT